MKTEILTKDGLVIYDEEMKAYVKTQGIGLTTDDVQAMINESDDGIKISEDNTYEPLETEE